MRTRLACVGALLALACVPSGHAAGCARSLPHGPRVPAPVSIRTVCGLFVLRPDRSVAYGRRASWAPVWAPRASSHPAPGTWVAHPHRRLAVYRDGHLLWHSHLTGGSDSVAVGHGHVAFTVYRHTGVWLWLAQLGGVERRVAAGEEIVGWIPAGLVTQRGAELRLRADDGRLLKTIGGGRAAFVADGRVVVISGSRIVRTDGRHAETIVDLRRYGMSGQAWLQPIDGGLWQVQAGRRVVFLDHHGRRVAAFSRAPISGNVVVLPNRRAILFAVQERRGDDDPGTLIVYRLDRGHAAARVLYRARVRQLSCGEWGGLAYRSGRVLFTSNEAGYAILDPAGRARPIDLTAVTRRLLPRRPNPGEPSYVGWG